MLTKTSYISLDEGDSYFQGKLSSQAWDNASNGERRKALIEASSILDRIDYHGQKLIEDQEHEFPRLLTISAIDELKYDTDNIPFILKEAVAEMSLALLDGFNYDKAIKEGQLKEQALAQIKTTYDRSTLPPYVRAGVTPTVWNLIQPLVRDMRNVLLSRV